MQGVTSLGLGKLPSSDKSTSELTEPPLPPMQPEAVCCRASLVGLLSILLSLLLSQGVFYKELVSQLILRGHCIVL